jgi:guanylate cyclase
MNFFPALASYLPRAGTGQDDAYETRLEKTILFSGSLLVITASSIWGALFYAYGELLASAISVGYVTVTIIGWILLGGYQRYQHFLLMQLVMGLLLPFLHFAVLGGFWSSGGVIVWSLISPVGAMIFYPYWRARWWWLAFLVVLIASGLVHSRIQHTNLLPQSLITTFFVLNLASVSGIVFAFISYFLSEKDKAIHMLRAEEQKSERLLLNILPREIAATLKERERVIADSFPEASILFADLVRFTELSASMEPAGMVALLNEIFSRFDYLVEKHGAEKIRTIGDNYMVVAGVPMSAADHAARLCRLALEMRTYLESRRRAGGTEVDFRIGINSGPVIGGVIGQKKFVYDVWGDAVNLASRMESQGKAGKIQLTGTTYRLVDDQFDCTPRGPVDVKGFGLVETWFLDGVRA